MTWNSILVWVLLLLLAAIDAVWLSFAGMSLTRDALILIFLPVLAILALAFFYTYRRRNTRIAALATMAAAALAFMSASCVSATLW